MKRIFGVHRLAALLLLLPMTVFARWYDAGTGRFLSEDPILGDIHARQKALPNPLGLHPWIYAHANPLRYTDPDGRAANDRYGNEFLPLDLQKACAGGTGNCLNAGFAAMRDDCAAGNETACAIRTAYGATVAAPVLSTKVGMLAWTGLSLLTSKGHTPGDQSIRDPLTAGFEGTASVFETAYKCGADISQGNGLTLSCGLTVFNLAMLSQARQAVRTTTVEETLIARAGVNPPTTPPFPTKGPIDPVIDNDVLVHAWNASRGSTRVNEVAALELIKNPQYEWVVTPTTFREFTRVANGSASRRRFLDKFENVTVLMDSRAATLRSGTRFSDVESILRNAANRSQPGLGNRPLPGGHSHFNDIINASFAEQLGIPYVTADRRFINFLNNHGRHARVNVRNYLDLVGGP